MDLQDQWVQANQLYFRQSSEKCLISKEGSKFTVKSATLNNNPSSSPNPSKTTFCLVESMIGRDITESLKLLVYFPISNCSRMETTRQLEKRVSLCQEVRKPESVWREQSMEMQISTSSTILCQQQMRKWLDSCLRMCSWSC